MTQHGKCYQKYLRLMAHQVFSSLLHVQKPFVDTITSSYATPDGVRTYILKRCRLRTMFASVGWGDWTTAYRDGCVLACCADK